jgi:hypothetical protein
VTAALTIALLGFLSAADPSGAAVDGGSAALVVVALPANASRPILEALNRLRGEATSVGFDVRFVDAGTEMVSANQLEDLGHGLRPAAVVAFSGSQSTEQPRHSLDVLFLDRASGRTLVEHFSVDHEEEDAEDRAEVIVAVRAVDFIRARMLDTLVSRATTPRAVGESPKPVPRQPAFYAGAGGGVLGTFSGFSPSVAPAIDAAYHVTGWLRVGASAFGFGSRPSAHSSAGEVALDQRYLGAQVTALGPAWHSLRLAVELGGGAYQVSVHSTANLPGGSRTDDVSSAALRGSLGASWAIAPHLLLDLRGGTLWLKKQPKIRGTESEFLGSPGRPSWFASALLGVAY